MRQLDATQYWFWDGYFGVVDIHDFTYERLGRLGVEPTVCFRIALVVLDNPTQRTAGYRQAISELIRWVADDPDTDEDSSELSRDHLERLTGQDFESKGEWAGWWNEARSYAFWSEDAGRLEIATDAADVNEALTPDDLLLDAEEYWFYTGRGWLSESAEEGNFMLGSLRIPPHGYNFRVDAAQLRDRTAKERGYRRALENLVADGLMLPAAQPQGLDSILRQMGTLTGESFADRDAGLGWWNTNRSRLVLSADGTRLIVRD